MNEHIEKLYKQAIGKDWAYDFDPQIAENFANTVVDRCCELIKEASMAQCIHTTYDSNLAECVKLELVKFVKNYFQR